MATSSQPPSMLNPVTNTITADRPSKKKKRRRKSKSRNSPHQQQKETQISERLTQWKSEKQQQIYSSKLLQALNQVRSRPRRSGKVVREAADTALAAAARGRTLWSRSILTNRLKVKFRKQTNKKMQRLKTTTTPSSAVVTGGSSSSRSMRRTRLSVLRLKGKNLPAIQRKVRVLGRLVPGCRKQPMPVVLEEATDYIAALEMQVRAMSRLAELLSGGSTTTAGSSSSAAY